MTINVDGQAAPVRFDRQVAACGAEVVGIHGLAGMPAAANFRVTVTWPGPGATTLIMRPLANNGVDFWTRPVIPPVLVFR